MTETHKKHTIYWLFSVCTLIFIMVLVGGITRLTHSGLSMVEWKPLMGTLPPLTEEAWTETFEKYKKFPEYQKVNQGMTLSEFKFIFFWEYIHRLLGRLIGASFFIPFIFFYFRKYYDSQWTKKLLIGFALGGLQGLMGWYMVKSGLVDRPSVSHFRLAAHLLLAFGIFSYLFWLILDLKRDMPSRGNNPFLKYSLIITGLIVLQITYGAFTAGLKAGFDYNTFPLMRGDIVPPEAFSFTPFIANFFENEPMVQFVHRTLAWILLIIVHWFVFAAKRKNPTAAQRKSHWIMLGVLGIQFILGVLTLVLTVPLTLAVMHQGGAFILLGAVMYQNHVYAKP